MNRHRQQIPELHTTWRPEHASILYFDLIGLLSFVLNRRNAWRTPWTEAHYFAALLSYIAGPEMVTIRGLQMVPVLLHKPPPTAFLLPV